MIEPLPHIAAMSAYPTAAGSAPEGVRVIGLAQNESLRPPCPSVIQAAADALARADLYPDSDWTALRMALAAHHGIPAEGLVCGNGSLDLIGRLAHAYAGPDRAVLAPCYAYPYFRVAAQMAHARFDTAEEVDATVSVDALLAAVRSDTRLVFLANPGNPTGTRISTAELRRLRDGLRDDVLLVIDEAYGEFADHLDARCFDMTEAGDTVVLRTFSKAYGMAGMRVGWGVFPPKIAAEIRKILNPSNVSAPTQAAAVAAVEAHAYMLETCAMTAELRSAATRDLRQAGFRISESYTNFVLIAFESEQAAARADAFLREGGVFLRPQRAAGSPSALRMTIAPQEAMDAAITRLTEWRRAE